MCCLVLKCNGILKYTFALVFLKGFQEHLLMVYNLPVSTMVLLEDLDRHFS